MTAKRWEIIDEEFISYTGGTAQLISNGECKVHLWEPPKDAQLFCDKLNAINEENEQLKEEKKELKGKASSWKITASEQILEQEELMKQIVDLKGELDYWKKRTLLLENKYREGDSIKWLRENTVWEQMPTNVKTIINTSNDTRDKVELEDIIGLVKTDEPTNSVELKKELYK